jgi:hypothetical protein
MRRKKKRRPAKPDKRWGVLNNNNIIKVQYN